MLQSRLSVSSASRVVKEVFRSACTTAILSLQLTSDQSYKQFTLVNYDSRVIPDLKIPHITTLGS